MPLHRPPSLLSSAVVLSSLVGAAAAQWTANPLLNTSVADAGGEQSVEKIAATSDGGCYIGWFDHRGAGYEVWLQRLDAAGVEQWPHNGVLVSNNPQNTSLVDWDLICDSEDHCVLTFTDVRAGGDLDIYAYRVDPTGAMQWGANGVALSQNGDFEPNPRVCEASDGDFVFVWANTGTQTLRLQRLDRLGVPRFAQDGIAISGDTGASPGWVRVAPADGGSVILSWVRTTAFLGNKHIHAQKFDALGNALWGGGTRLPVFDGGSVPIAHDPRLQSDGLGGAVIAWHFAAGSVFSVRVQHLDALGNEVWPHDGVDVSTNGNSHFDPSVTWNVAAQAAVVVWNERNTAQSVWGISAQRIDALGNRAWGASGVTLRPIDAVTKFAPVAVPFQGGAMAFVLEQPVGSLNKNVIGMRVDAAGAVKWTPVVQASIAASDKLRLLAVTSPSGNALLAWQDLRALDGGNIVAQSVGANAVLAPALGDALAYGCGVNPAGSLVVDGRPAIGTTVTVGVDNPVATQTAGSLPLLALATAPQPGFPCGLVAPGFGMSAPGSNGEILLDLGAVAQTFVLPPWTGAGPSTLPLAIPLDLAFVGVSLFWQGALLDGTPGAGVPMGLTTGSRWTFGF